MRELFRFAAKAKMNNLGYSKPNKCLKHNHWRELTGAWPTHIYTGEKMTSGYHGPKWQGRGHIENLFTYGTWEVA